jgi:hypothetical protein
MPASKTLPNFVVSTAIILSSVTGACASNSLDRNPFAPRDVVVTHGWEKDLVKADPNLAQWNWAAMYSMVNRNTRRTAPRTTNTRCGSNGLVEQAARYGKPNHAEMPRGARVAVAARLAFQPRLDHTTSTSLQYCSSRKAAPALAYGRSYQNLGGSDAGAFDYAGQSSTSAVHGKIISKRM